MYNILVDIFPRDQKILVANEENLQRELTLQGEEDGRYEVEAELEEGG